jgi:hypothetical protein
VGSLKGEETVRFGEVERLGDEAPASCAGFAAARASIAAGWDAGLFAPGCVDSGVGAGADASGCADFATG